MTPVEQAIELLKEAAYKEREVEREREDRGPRVHRRTSRRHRNPFGDKETEIRLRTLEAMEEMVTLMRHITGPLPPPGFEIHTRMGTDTSGGLFTSDRNPAEVDVESVQPKPRPRTSGECPKDGSVSSQFEHDLAKLINKHSLENETNVPDFILASYLVQCLEAFRHTVQHTHNWFEGSRWNNPCGITDNRDETEHACHHSKHKENEPKLYNRPQGPAMPIGGSI